ncbi:MAG TPA: SMC-Scp complex subunit ScpB [Candidatus Saccharimonadales bacterium]|jgi:segregation and condensation protein B|nr:SMC-Scp complex subunit ScpB [Candidatus Saccharimonadales bacterium]
MSLKAKIEALIYAAEEPIPLDQMASLLKEDLLALKGLPQPAPSEDLGPNSGPAPTEEAPAPAAPPMPVAAAPVLDKAAEKKSAEKKERTDLRNLLTPVLEEVIAGYASEDRGLEIRKVAGGYRMSTKPEHHDVVRSFAKSLKPPIRLSLQALETLAVIAYKQPVTVPEISEIRGVDSSGVIGTLFDRKLINTAGRKAVVGRPMLYKTTKDFLVRFGLSDLGELPSIEEFEKLAVGDAQVELFDTRDAAMADATGVPDVEPEVEEEEQSVPADLLGDDLPGDDLPANNLPGNDLSGNDLSVNDLPEDHRPAHDVSGNEQPAEAGSHPLEIAPEETEGIPASDSKGG